jgi:hypothetical protein
MNTKAPEIAIAKPAIAQELKAIPDTEAQVIIHGVFKNTSSEFQLIRIWQTVVLIPFQSGEKSKLLHVENITLFPSWTPVEPNTTHQFTLLFARLPSDCILFDLVEEIPQAGGFEIRNISRNKQDVYHLEF